MSLIYKFTYNTEKEACCTIVEIKVSMCFFFLLLFRELKSLACACVPLLLAEPSTVDSLGHYFKAVSKDKHFAKDPRMQVLNRTHPGPHCLLAACSFTQGCKFQFHVS